VEIIYQWRGDFQNDEFDFLHNEALQATSSNAFDWQAVLGKHSLGWVTARDREPLVGFVNVIWDGFAHAWIQDTMVLRSLRSHGIGTQLVRIAREEARRSGCEWLHVDFDDSLKDFYYQACGFTHTSAGLIPLK
jgi:GNAT superfamily N-acetyltransferase